MKDFDTSMHSQAGAWEREKMEVESFQGNFFNKLKTASASFEMMERLK